MADTATIERPTGAGAYLALLGPHDLLMHPSNVRKDLGDMTELKASIAASGVLQALLVVPDGDQFRIVAGHRRAAAAAQCIDETDWPAGMEPAVPCVVRPDLAGLAAEHIVSMLVENDQRADLTESERANGYAQLELFGLDASMIAERTGRPVDHVQAALKLTKLGEQAVAAADKGTLTLEDVKKIEQFDDDPKAMERILKGVDNSWAVRHRINEEERKRDERDATAVLETELADAGVLVVKQPKGWPWESKECTVADLRTADGEEVDVDTVKATEGFAAFITKGYGGVKATYICLDPEGMGYKRRGNTRYRTAEQLAAEEAAKAAAEERKQKLGEAQELRRQFLIETWGSAKAAKKLHVEGMRQAVVNPKVLHDGDGELIRALSGGGNDDELLTAGVDRLGRVLVAMWIAAEEANLYRVIEGHRWDRSKAAAVAWLDRLVGAGYALSEVEADARAGVVGEIEEEERERQERAAEHERVTAELGDDPDFDPDEEPQEDGDEPDGDEADDDE